MACALGGPDGRTLFGVVCKLDLARMGELVTRADDPRAGDDFSAGVLTWQVDRARAGRP